MKYNKSFHLSPSSDFGYDPSGFSDRDGKAWYAAEVNSDGSLLDTPDAFVRGPVKLTSSYLFQAPREAVFDSAKDQFASKRGNKIITYGATLGQVNAELEDYFTDYVENRYFSILVMAGISKRDNVNEEWLQKIRWFPIVQWDVNWNEDQPDAAPEVKFIPQKNPTSSALALTNVGTITGLTDADSENDLVTADWEALDFSVAPNKYRDIQSCAMII